MQHAPKVSVIIPVYNGARFLKDAIESVLRQSWQDFELIIVDNASIDRTLDVAYGFNDPRIIVCPEKNHVSIFENFNRSAAHARGHYLKYLCADDELMPSCIEKFLEIFELNLNIGLVTSSRITIDESGSEKGLSIFTKKSGLINGTEALKIIAAEGNFIGEPTTTMFRRDRFQQLKGFPVEYRQLGDLHFWCQLLIDQNLFYHPLPLSKFRIHKAQTTNINANNLALWFNEELMILEEFKRWSKQIGWSIQIHNRSQALVCARLLRALFYNVCDNRRNLKPVLKAIPKSFTFSIFIRSILINFHLLTKKFKCLCNKEPIKL